MEQSQNASATLFSPRLDAIYFALHAVFFILTIAMAVGVLPSVSWEQPTVRIVVAFIFFNALHTVLTWLGLFLLPEARSLVKAQWKSEGASGRLRRWIVLTVMAGVTWTVAEVFVFKSHAPEIRITLSLVLVVLASFHNVGQTKGLALMQTHQIQGDKKIAHWERRFFDLFVIAIFLGGLKLMLSKHLKGFLPSWWNTAWLVVGSAVFLALIVLAFRYQRSFRSKKFWFSTTAIYHPLLLLSPAAFVFQRALHGVEYLFLSIGMTKRSSVKWGLGAWTLLLVALFLTGLSKVAILKTAFPIKQYMTAEWIRAFVFFGVWVEFTHYYLDSILFRFQDPSVREHIGPLLRPRL